MCTSIARIASSIGSSASTGAARDTNIARASSYTRPHASEVAML